MGDGLVGKGDVLKKIAELFAKAPGAVDAALYQEGLAVDALAVSKTPVDTGRLRASHYVGPPENNGGVHSVPIGFGAEYALAVHERTDQAHKTGEAKFLEKALHERMTGFEPRLARRARANLAAGILVAPIDGSVPTSPQDPGPQGGASRRMIEAAHRENRRRARTARRRARKAEKLHAKKTRKAAARTARRVARHHRKQAAKQRRAEARERKRTNAKIRAANKAHEKRVKSQAAREAKRRQRREQKAHAKLHRDRTRNPKRFDF